MSNKKFVVMTLSLVLSILIIVAGLNIVIDPFFQYHKPYFGLEPVITYSRYQNPGIAKNFDFENATLGNSLSENFKVSVLNEALGGETAKLTMAGSHPVDWIKILDLLKNKNLKKIMINLDPYILYSYSGDESSLPSYLYNYNKIDDVYYLLNLQVLFDYTMDTVRRNMNNEVPQYDEIYLWEDDWEYGKEVVLKNYSRQEISKEEVDLESSVSSPKENVKMLSKYFMSMPETEFIFFFSPLSMIYWDSVVRKNSLEAHKVCFLTAISELVKYDNVTVYLWNDDEMLSIMGNLDNYIDEAHYSPEICEIIASRIKDKKGIITKENYRDMVNKLFDYLSSFDYDSLFE